MPLAAEGGRTEKVLDKTSNEYQAPFQREQEIKIVSEQGIHSRTQHHRREDLFPEIDFTIKEAPERRWRKQEVCQKEQSDETCSPSD